MGWGGVLGGQETFGGRGRAVVSHVLGVNVTWRVRRGGVGQGLEKD